MKYSFTAKSDEDFQSIYRHIAQNNPNAARRVTDNIENTCEALASMPGMGKHPNYVHDSSIMVFPVKKYSDYLVFYA